MNNLIYTIAVNSEKIPYFRIGVESIRKYAEKIGVDFLIKYHQEDDFILFDKFNIKYLLEVYDRVLWIDADIIIKDNAPDIFKEYPDCEKIYIHDEAEREKINYNSYIQNIVDRYNLIWPKNKYGKYKYLNCGVYLISNGNETAFSFDNGWAFDGYPYLKEQTTMNCNINYYNLQVENLDKKYNAMAYFGEDGYFIHFANMQNRENIMRDYK